ncbi:hypothetical protein DFP72DRAFT_1153476 [Ephemerocybe angulata]|uniref:Uncharacterized protein n=1 Tax=Ephemerocybe angulata TaxID=980116 RepID=A0A8H6HGB6_9AGAR|nr:hypothetical protein DFP72DRAFT_1153476 [Tulosesus angulatus]
MPWAQFRFMPTAPIPAHHIHAACDGLKPYHNFLESIPPLDTIKDLQTLSAGYPMQRSPGDVTNVSGCSRGNANIPRIHHHIHRTRPEECSVGVVGREHDVVVPGGGGARHRLTKREVVGCSVSLDTSSKRCASTIETRRSDTRSMTFAGQDGLTDAREALNAQLTPVSYLPTNIAPPAPHMLPYISPGALQMKHPVTAVKLNPKLAVLVAPIHLSTAPSTSTVVLVVTVAMPVVIARRLRQTSRLASFHRCLSLRRGHCKKRAVEASVDGRVKCSAEGVEKVVRERALAKTFHRTRLTLLSHHPHPPAVVFVHRSPEVEVGWHFCGCCRCVGVGCMMQGWLEEKWGVWCNAMVVTALQAVGGGGWSGGEVGAGGGETSCAGRTGRRTDGTRNRTQDGENEVRMKNTVDSTRKSKEEQENVAGIVARVRTRNTPGS